MGVQAPKEPAPATVAKIDPPLITTTMMDSSQAPTVGAGRSEGDFREDFKQLQILAATGRPETLNERYDRREIEQRSSLTHSVYNFLLVFGEV